MGEERLQGALEPEGAERQDKAGSRRPHRDHHDGDSSRGDGQRDGPHSHRHEPARAQRDHAGVRGDRSRQRGLEGGEARQRQRGTADEDRHGIGGGEEGGGERHGQGGRADCDP